MLKPVLLLLLPLAVWTSPCQNITRVVLECKDMSLEELTKHFNHEELLKLSNVRGEKAWNASYLAEVNTVLGDHVSLSAEALVDLMTVPHLSTLELEKSFLEIPNTPQSASFFAKSTLRRLRLSGSLKNPPPIFNFTYLSELDLSGNNFTSVPSIEGGKIVYLNLSNTGIRLVNNLDKLPSLEELDLTDNGLRSIEQDAFGYNEDLERLWLQRNNLRTIYFNASKLQVLNLNYNDMAIVVGEFFLGFPLLSTLYLVDNRISKMVDPFKYTPHLKVVDLSNNDLNALDGLWFSNTPELEVLKLAHNNLFELPQLSAPLHSLHHLNLSSNGLQALGKQFFDQTPALASLDVTDNQIVSIDHAMSFLKNLNKLHIAHNFLNISDVTFEGAEQLNFLNASYNKLEITLMVFKSNKVLRDVDLSHNSISELCIGDSAPTHIQNLDISSNKVRSLRCLGSLISLDVTENPLECNMELQAKLQSLAETSTEISLHNSHLVEGVMIVPVSDDQGILKGQVDWLSVYKVLCPDGPKVIMTTPSAEAKQKMSTHPALNNEDNYNMLADALEPESPTDGVDSQDLSAYHDDDDKDEEDEDDDDEDDVEEDEDVQSERSSILGIENIIRFKNGRHSFDTWASWAFTLLGICLVLLLLNLLMFVWYRRKARVEARLGSDRPYKQLHNEVYKGTTSRVDGNQRVANLGRVMTTFKNEKLGEILSKFGFRSNVAGDTESQDRMIPGNQLA